MPLIFLHDANSTRVEDERWPPWSEVEAALKSLPGQWRSFGSRHNEERNESAGSSSSEMLRGEATSTLKTHDEKRGDEWSWLTYEDASTLKSHEEKRAEDAGSSSSKMLRGEARSTLRTHDERRDDEWTWLTYENPWVCEEANKVYRYFIVHLFRDDGPGPLGLVFHRQGGGLCINDIQNGAAAAT